MKNQLYWLTWPADDACRTQKQDLVNLYTKSTGRLIAMFKKIRYIKLKYTNFLQQKKNPMVIQI